MSSWGRSVLHARLMWRASPVHTLLCLLLTVLNAAATTVMMVVSGHLVGSLIRAAHDGAGSAAATSTWHLMIALAVLFVAAPLVDVAQEASAHVLSARYLVLVFDLLAETSLTPHGIGHLEDPAFTSRLEGLVLATRDWTFMQGVSATWDMLTYRLMGLGALVVLLTWNWWVPFLVVAGWLLLSRTFGAWIKTAHDDLLDVTGNDRRRATYLRTLLLGRDSAKEVRLFGLTDLLARRYRQTWMTAMTIVWRHRTKTLGPVAGATLGMLIVNAAAFAILGEGAWTGAVTVATLVTMTQALIALESFGPVGDTQVAVARNTAAVAHLAQLREEIGLPARGGSGAPAPDAPATDASGKQTSRAQQSGPARIVLDDVSFGYASRSDRVFSGLSLTIPAGQSVAVVGVNGAGKSTLIKLICGLYPPTSGTVRIDGADPAVDDATRHRVAVIFQDFVRYHLSLRDNVGLAIRDHDDRQQVIARALDDASGGPLVHRLSHGWDTVLSAEYAGGTDLSGGQWQRVALARAFASAAGGAGVLVLDEPTAALDVRAEAELFDRFLEVTRGLTTVLVSHRLSSVRHADRIIVVADGRVVEDGSHAELIASGGAYAQMFRLQASRFAVAGDDHHDDRDPDAWLREPHGLGGGGVS